MKSSKKGLYCGNSNRIKFKINIKVLEKFQIKILENCIIINMVKKFCII